MTDNHTPISPKFAGAFFFAIYAFFFMLFAKYTLFSLQDRALLPLFSTIIISFFTGAFSGAILGNALVKKSRWTRPFFIGIALALLALFLGSLGILVHYYFHDPVFLQRFVHWRDYFVMYGVILLSLILTIGIWLIPITGLVAIYFNKHFYPGLLIADKNRLKANPVDDK